jgi:hypothetical protein
LHPIGAFSAHAVVQSAGKRKATRDVASAGDMSVIPNAEGTSEMTTREQSPRPLFFAMIAGILCAGGLIAITALSRNGWLMLLPYVALIVASATYLRTRNIGGFSHRFLACLIAFVVATLMTIFYIDIVVHHRAVSDMILPKFLLSAGLMLLIGAGGSAIVAAATGHRRAAP